MKGLLSALLAALGGINAIDLKSLDETELELTDALLRRGERLLRWCRKRVDEERHRRTVARAEASAP